MASRNCASSSTFHTSVGNIGSTSDATFHRVVFSLPMCGSRYSVRQLLYALCAMPANLSPEYKKAYGGDSATPEQPAGGADRDIQQYPLESRRNQRHSPRGRVAQGARSETDLRETQTALLRAAGGSANNVAAGRGSTRLTHCTCEPFAGGAGAWLPSSAGAA